MPTITEWVRRRFPEFSWEGAESTHGAFHDVVLGRDVVARVVGADAVARAVVEHSVWREWQHLDLPIAVPSLASGVRSGDGWHAYLVGRLPGSPTDEAPWESVRDCFAQLLTALRTVEVSGLTLPPVRAWCGGESFPEIVRTELVPLLSRSADARVAAGAVDVVDRMLHLGPSGPPVLVHGDLGPHNLLWDTTQGELGTVTGLIDVDHACVADQVVDLAPLVEFYGRSAVREIAAAADVERAVIYRATLSLQVAAAAHLGNAKTLRDHALGNFIRRHGSQVRA